MNPMPEPLPLDYEPPDPKRKQRVLLAQLGIIGLAGLVLVGSLCGVALNRTRETVNEVHCASNLRQIGQAIMLYRSDYGGTYPPDLQTVLLTQTISGTTLLCPSSSDTYTNGAPVAQIAAELAKPGHCSYIYVGSGLAPETPPDSIVLIEDPDNHDLRGANIVYADGHVDWQSFETVMTYLNDLNKGANPPTTPVTIAASQARRDYEKNWKSRMTQLKSGAWKIPSTQPAK